MQLNPFGQPIVQRKQQATHESDQKGLLQIQLKIKGVKFFSSYYTRVDQVFLVWSLITAVIFLTAQFLPLNWSCQAVIWSILTLMGSAYTIHLAWDWVSAEYRRWIVYAWLGLMLAGIGLTNLSIFGGLWTMMPHLCPLWMGLSALGYFATSWGLRSRAFFLNGVLHLGSLALFPIFPAWQFLLTGLITAGSLVFLAEVQWDMAWKPALACKSSQLY